MADNNNGDAQLHIAMLPWLAFGHLIPFLQLAKHLPSKGYKISFISTPTNIDRLPQIPQSLTNLITFVKINIPKVDNIPKNAESTKDLPLNKVRYLKVACDGLRKPMADFLKASSPDWIIFYFNTYWLGPTAAEHNVLAAFFFVAPALVLGFLGYSEVLMHGGDDQTTPEDFINRPKWVSFKSQVRQSLFQIHRVHEQFNADKENVSDMYRMVATIHDCDVVVVRSSFDSEREWLNLLTELYQKPIIPAGLLPSTASDGDDACCLETKQWLNKHEKGSVVYIGFETETKKNQYELTQLALGLELSGLPFYRVLIDQRGSSNDEVIELPSGFEERTRERGVVCRSWVPQFEILCHDSVGGLLM